jgi:hypothetical protein
MMRPHCFNAVLDQRLQNDAVLANSFSLSYTQWSGSVTFYTITNTNLKFFSICIKSKSVLRIRIIWMGIRIRLRECKLMRYRLRL